MLANMVMYGVEWRYTSPDLDPGWKMTLREAPCQPWLSQKYEEATAYANSIRIEGTETRVVEFEMTLKVGA